MQKLCAHVSRRPHTIYKTHLQCFNNTGSNSPDQLKPSIKLVYIDIGKSARTEGSTTKYSPQTNIILSERPHTLHVTLLWRCEIGMQHQLSPIPIMHITAFSPD